VWILEKWISGQQSCQMTPQEYENFGARCPQSGLLIEGPYPVTGVYEHVWTFDADTLQGGIEGALDKIIALVNKGAGRSYEEIKAANKEFDAKEEKRACVKRNPVSESARHLCLVAHEREISSRFVIQSPPIRRDCQPNVAL
jgi:hypothetical protein